MRRTWKPSRQRSVPCQNRYALTHTAATSSARLTSDSIRFCDTEEQAQTAAVEYASRALSRSLASTVTDTFLASDKGVCHFLDHDVQVTAYEQDLAELRGNHDNFTRDLHRYQGKVKCKALILCPRSYPPARRASHQTAAMIC